MLPVSMLEAVVVSAEFSAGFIASTIDEAKFPTKDRPAYEVTYFELLREYQR
jgi:hypothetical protein